MPVVPVPIDKLLALDLEIECDSLYLDWSNGVFEDGGLMHRRVLGIMRWIWRWNVLLDGDASANVLLIIGCRILEEFPEHPRIATVKDAFEKLFQQKTCKYGYGAPMA